MDGRGNRVRRLWSCLRRSERGQAMAEFALLVPVFMVVLFAIVDFGNAYSKYVSITNAARDGARLGVTGDTSANIVTRVNQTSGICNGPTYTTCSDSNLSVSVSGAGGSSGSDVTVTASYSYSFITPLAALVRLLPGSRSIGSSITLTSTAVMRIE